MWKSLMDTVKNILITKREEAQAIPVAVTNYALFVEGRYITREIQSKKYCLQLELSSIYNRKKIRVSIR